MTKKDYVLIAGVIEAVKNSTYIGANSVEDIISIKLANAFVKDNPKFDKGRFLTACGVGQSEDYKCGCEYGYSDPLCEKKHTFKI